MQNANFLMIDGLLIVHVLAHTNFRELDYKHPHVLFTKQLIPISTCYWVVLLVPRLLLGCSACSWVVPFVTGLLLGCYWVVPLVPHFSNGATLRDHKIYGH